MSGVIISESNPAEAAADMRRALEYEYMNNPVVHQLIFTVQLGKLRPTEALIRAIKALVAQNEILAEDYLQLQQKAVTKTIVLKEEDGYQDNGLPR